MRLLSKLLIAFLVLLSLTSCWDQKIYETLGFLLNVGVDVSSDGKVLITFTSPVIEGKSAGQGQESENKVEINIADSNLVREGREISRLTSPRKLEGGKVQNVMFGIDAARQGMSEYLEIFERDISNPVQARVMIVDGRANDLIVKGIDFKEKPRLAMYINQLLDSNSKSGYCPDESIIKFDIEYSIPGLDPIVPIISLEKDGLRVVGTALTNGDRMTGRIGTQETACLMLLMGKRKDSILAFSLPGELNGPKRKIAVYVSGLKAKSRVEIRDGIPNVDFDISVRLILDEYTWDSLSDQEKKARLEKSLANSVESSVNDTFKQLLKANCDAIGIGDKVRAKYYNYWRSIGEEEGWRKIYPRISMEVNAKAHIERYGVIN